MGGGGVFGHVLLDMKVRENHDWACTSEGRLEIPIVQLLDYVNDTVNSEWEGYVSVYMRG